MKKPIVVILDADSLGHDISLESLYALPVEIIKYGVTNASETVKRLEDAAVCITNKCVLRRPELEQLPKLKGICITATGLDNVDLDAAREKCVVVKNVAGYSTESVVQTTFSLVLYLQSRLSYYSKFTASGSWTKSPTFTDLGAPFTELAGKRWGIIGLGAIGTRVAEIAAAFKMEVVYHSTSGKNTGRHLENLPLLELLRTSHVVSIHAPLNQQTRNLLGEAELRTLEAGSILVNLGRGGIIDEAALRLVLEDHEIYVGLDVLTNEPMQQGNPLLSLTHPERLLITPHIAWASVESRTRLIEAVARNVSSVLSSLS